MAEEGIVIVGGPAGECSRRGQHGTGDTWEGHRDSDGGSERELKPSCCWVARDRWPRSRRCRKGRGECAWCWRWGVVEPRGARAGGGGLGTQSTVLAGPVGLVTILVLAEARGHLLEGHTWILWYWCVLLMTFSARMLKQ